MPLTIHRELQDISICEIVNSKFHSTPSQETGGFIGAQPAGLISPPQTPRACTTPLTASDSHDHKVRSWSGQPRQPRLPTISQDHQGDHIFFSNGMLQHQSQAFAKNQSRTLGFASSCAASLSGAMASTNIALRRLAVADARGVLD